MENSAVTLPILDLPEEDMGPAMKELSPMRRRFVIARLNNPLWSDTACALAAGYSQEGNTAKTAAWINMHHEGVIKAIKELADRALRRDVGMAIAAMQAIAKDPNHKNHFDAVKYIMAYAGMAPETVQRHIHELETRGMSRDEIVKEIQEVTARLADRGVDAQKMLGYKVTDAEFIAVDADTAALDKDWSV